MKDGKKPVRTERAQEQALPALPVEDELAAHGPVHAIGGLGQVHDLHFRPVFAVAVGEHAISRGWPVQVYNRLSQPFDDADLLHSQFLSVVLWTCTPMLP